MGIQRTARRKASKRRSRAGWGQAVKKLRQQSTIGRAAEALLGVWRQSQSVFRGVSKRKVATSGRFSCRVAHPPRAITMPEAKSTLLRLCNMVGEAFSRGQPPPAEIQRICSLLDSVPMSELGLQDAGKVSSKADLEITNTSSHISQNGLAQDLLPETWPVITYLHIHECAEYSLGIFCIPKHAVIPLHDHPGMTVFSRLLYGDMNVKAFDVVPDVKGSSNGELNGTAPPQITVKLAYDKVMHGPSRPTVLYPRSGGNIHEFTALTDCAVLDVLAPPYCHDEGRDCTYYEEIHASTLARGKDVAILQALVEPPEQLEVVRGIYTGLEVRPDHPEISDTSGSLEQLTLE